MYATTEEAVFDRMGARRTPGAEPRAYEKHSPHRTPKTSKRRMLVIHNDLDFPRPVSEGIQLFTTLPAPRRASRFINFPTRATGS